MKKNYIFLISFVLLSGFSLVLQAQRGQYVHQVITLNGGKFEVTPPFADYASIQKYDPTSQTVTVFDHIYTQSVQDLVIAGNIAYAAAQDSIVMYNLDTYQRVAAVADSGLSKLYFFDGKLIVSKQYPVTRFFVEVLDGTDLSVIARIDGISGECAGIVNAGSYLYVADNGGYLGTTGKLAVINPNDWTLVNEVDLGADAIGIYNLYNYGSYVYTINRTPFGGAAVGSITRFNFVDQTFNNNVLGVVVGDGIGLSKHNIFLKMNEGIGSFNCDTQTIEDTTIVADPGSVAGITIHAGALDIVNDYMYITIGNRTSFSKGFVVTTAGDSVTTFNTGTNAEAVAIDYRFPAGVSTLSKGAFTINPNPADDHAVISFEGIRVNAVKIYDLTGKNVFTSLPETGSYSVNVNTSELTPGLYIAVLETPEGNKVQKFVRK